MFKHFFQRRLREPSNWSDSSADRFFSSNLDEIIINRNLNWRGSNNYSFLRAIKSSLRKLTIVDFADGVDIRVIDELHLEELTLEVGVKAQWPDSFPDSLRILKFEARNGFPDVASLGHLEKIRVWGRPGWNRLPEFQSDFLRSVSVDCSTLSELSFHRPNEIQELVVSNVRNLAIDSSHFSRTLVTLEVIDAKGTIDLTPLSGCNSIKRLCLDGSSLCVPSLRPLCGLGSLEFLFLGQTRFLDDDSKAILEMATLKDLMFMDRSSYNIKLCEALKVLGARRIGLEI